MEVKIEEIIIEHNYTYNDVPNDSFEMTKEQQSKQSLHESGAKKKKKTMEDMHEEVVTLLHNINKNIFNISMSLKDIALSLTVKDPRQE